MHVVKGCNQFSVLRQQHTVTEYVAAMSPIPKQVKSVFGNQYRLRPEMTLNRFPAAFGRDTHFLMVITVTATRCECITEPKLYSREIEFAISENVAVPLSAATTKYGHLHRDEHIQWVDDFTVQNVIGNIEQCTDKDAVAFLTFGEEKLHGPPSVGNCLQTKPPLAPTGTIGSVFTCCVLPDPILRYGSSRRSDQRRPPRATLP